MEDKGPSSQVLRLGLYLQPNWVSCMHVTFLVVLHVLFTLTVTTVCLASSGYAVSWSMLFLPIVSTLVFSLLYMCIQTLRAASRADDRAVFIRAFIIFLLLICIASATLAAVTAKGVSLSATSSPLDSLPSIDPFSGALILQWRRERSLVDTIVSTVKNPVDHTPYGSAFIHVKVDDSREITTTPATSKAPSTLPPRGPWLGVNISFHDVREVYPKEYYDHTCFAQSSSSFIGEGGGHGASPKECPSKCSTRTISQHPANQFCESLGNGAFCMLYVMPATLLETSKEENALQSEIKDSMQQQLNATLCSNTCVHNNDLDCDDGGPDSKYGVCDFGTDCGACGPRSVNEYAKRFSESFPTCGYQGKLESVPQRYVAPWVRGRRVTCRRKCTVSEVSEVCGNVTWADSCKLESTSSSVTGARTIFRHGNEWCCDELVASGSMLPVVAFPVSKILTGSERSPEGCVRACLVENFADQHACALTQFSQKNGACERLVIRGRLCSTNDALHSTNCSDYLSVERHGKSASWPISDTRGHSLRHFGNMDEDSWDGIRVQPNAKLAENEPDWAIYVMLTQATYSREAGSGFTESVLKSSSSDDMQVVLAPFICVPLFVGLLIICACFTPLNCLPETRLTDPDTCAWDYFFFPGSETDNAVAHNARILLIILALSVSELLLMFRKAVNMEISIIWSHVLIPIWIVVFFVLLSTMGLLSRLAAVCRNANVVDSSLGAGGHAGSNFPQQQRARERTSSQLSPFTDKGRLVIKALVFCLVLLVPCCAALALLAVRLDSCPENSSLFTPSEPADTECYVSPLAASMPILAGLGLHILLYMAYLIVAMRSAMYDWKRARLEAMEAAARAEIRRLQSEEIATLSKQFMQTNVGSQELIRIMRLVVFKGSGFGITHEELKVLGHSKVAVLTSQGKLDEVWTPQVAKEFGDLLLFLLSKPAIVVNGSRRTKEFAPYERVRFADLRLSAFQGYLRLLFCPATIPPKVLDFVTRQECRPESESEQFSSFLHAKEQVATRGGFVLMPNEKLSLNNGELELVVL